MTTLRVLLTLSLIGALAGCGSDGSASGPIGIAVLSPQTGPSSGVGEEMRNTVQMILEDRDNTVAGRPVEVTFVDSESDADIAVTNYRTAVQDPENNIVLGALNWHSNVSVSVMDVAADEGLAHVAGLGATGTVNEKFEMDPARYNVWSKGWPTPVKLSANYVTAIEDAIAAGSWSPAEKRVAIYGEDTDWGRGFGGGIKTQLEEAGWTVVAEEYVDPEGIDFSGPLQTIVDAEPTLLAGTIASEVLLRWVNQADDAFADAATQPLIVADGLGWNSMWYDSLADASNKVVDQIPQFASEEAQAFAARYESTYGSAPSPSAAGLAYDYFRFALMALEAAQAEHGEITRETVRDVHANMVLKGMLTMNDGILMNEYVWTEDTAPDMVVGGDAFTFPVLQYNEGESTVVWPESLASSNLSAP